MNKFIDRGMIYEDKEHNVVFVSKNKDWYEIRGTITYGVPFKQNAPGGTEKAWCFGGGDTIYICEGAIDAMSLYVLQNRERALYVSMHGVHNHSIIDKCIQSGKKVFLCVDNDKHGDECRRKYPYLENLIPAHIDWNEDLLAKMKLESTRD